jgi:hypothetical protein
LLKRPEQGAGKGHSGRAVTDVEMPCDSDLEECFPTASNRNGRFATPRNLAAACLLTLRYLAKTRLMELLSMTGRWRTRLCQRRKPYSSVA